MNKHRTMGVNPFSDKWGDSYVPETPGVVMTDELKLVIDHFSGRQWGHADEMWYDVFTYVDDISRRLTLTSDESDQLAADVKHVDEFACYEFPGEAGE